MLRRKGTVTNTFSGQFTCVFCPIEVNKFVRLFTKILFENGFVKTLSNAELECNVSFLKTVAHTGQPVNFYPGGNVPRQYVAYPRKLKVKHCMFFACYFKLCALRNKTIRSNQLVNTERYIYCPFDPKSV